MTDLAHFVNPLNGGIPQASTSSTATAIPVPNVNHRLPVETSPLPPNIADFPAGERSQNSNKDLPVMGEQPKQQQDNPLLTKEEIIQSLQEEGMLFVNDIPASIHLVTAITVPSMDPNWEFIGKHFMVELKDADPIILDMDGLRGFIGRNHQTLGRKMIEEMSEIYGFEDLIDFKKPSKEELDQRAISMTFPNDLEGSEVKSFVFPGIKPNGEFKEDRFSVQFFDGMGLYVEMDRLREFIDENSKILGKGMLYKIYEKTGIEDVWDLCNAPIEGELMAKSEQRPIPVMEEYPEMQHDTPPLTTEEITQNLQEEGRRFVNGMPDTISEVKAIILPNKGNHFMIQLLDADPIIVEMGGLRGLIAENSQILSKNMIQKMSEINGLEDLLDLKKPSQEELDQRAISMTFPNDLEGSEVKSVIFPGMKPNGEFKEDRFVVEKSNGIGYSIEMDRLREFIDENNEALGKGMLYRICEITGIEDVHDLCNTPTEEENMAKSEQRPSSEQAKRDYRPSSEELRAFSPQKSSSEQANIERRAKEVQRKVKERTRARLS